MDTEINFLIEQQEICHNTAYEIGQCIRPLCTSGVTLILKRYAILIPACCPFYLTSIARLKKKRVHYF